MRSWEFQASSGRGIDAFSMEIQQILRGAYCNTFTIAGCSSQSVLTFWLPRANQNG